jgi:hypothetical protein
VGPRGSGPAFGAIDGHRPARLIGKRRDEGRLSTPLALAGQGFAPPAARRTKGGVLHGAKIERPGM